MRFWCFPYQMPLIKQCKILMFQVLFGGYIKFNVVIEPAVDQKEWLWIWIRLNSISFTLPAVSCQINLMWYLHLQLVSSSMLFTPNLIPIYDDSIHTNISFRHFSASGAWVAALFCGKILFMWNFLKREKTGHTFSHTQTCRTVKVEGMLTHSTETNTTLKTYMVFFLLYIMCSFTGKLIASFQHHMILFFH